MTSHTLREEPLDVPPGQPIEMEESPLCFFCGQESADPRCALPIWLGQVLKTLEPSELQQMLSVTIFGDTLTELTGPPSLPFSFWRKRKVAVPRCARCNTAHSTTHFTKWDPVPSAVFVSSALLGAVLGVVFALRTAEHAIAVATILTGLVGTLIGAIPGIYLALEVGKRIPSGMPRGIKSSGEAGEFPLVKRLRAADWETLTIENAAPKTAGGLSCRIPIDLEEHFVRSIEEGQASHTA
jgi:hypothetical protein